MFEYIGTRRLLPNPISIATQPEQGRLHVRYAMRPCSVIWPMLPNSLPRCAMRYDSGNKIGAAEAFITRTRLALGPGDSGRLFCYMTSFWRRWTMQRCKSSQLFAENCYCTYPDRQQPVSARASFSASRVNCSPEQPPNHTRVSRSPHTGMEPYSCEID